MLASIHGHGEFVRLAIEDAGAYYAESKPIIKTLLRKAGVRLAKVLNEALARQIRRGVSGNGSSSNRVPRPQAIVSDTLRRSTSPLRVRNLIRTRRTLSWLRVVETLVVCRFAPIP